MKKRILALALCLCLLAGAPALFQAEAAGGVCFISVNDDLLELTSQPYFYGGVTYLPYWIFTDYGFGIYYSYFSSVSAAMVYDGSKQVFFDLANGTSYDIENNFFDARAVMYGGTVYLPAVFMSNYFGGLSCTYIPGGEYGDLVRVKDSSAMLDDDSFMRAASNLMRSRYTAYFYVPPAPATPTPAPTPTPTPTPSPSPTLRTGVTCTLSLVGLPGSTVLNALRHYRADACFFLSPEDIESDPALVRRLSGEGYGLGVLCGENTLADYEKASALLYECARTRTVLVTALGDDAGPCAEAAAAGGLVYWSYDADGISTPEHTVEYAQLESLLDEYQSDFSLFLSCGKETDGFINSLLRYFSSEKLSTRRVRETDVWR